MKLHEQVAELKINNVAAVECIYDFMALLNSNKFKNTDAELNNWISTSDVNRQLQLILNALAGV